MNSRKKSLYIETDTSEEMEKSLSNLHDGEIDFKNSDKFSCIKQLCRSRKTPISSYMSPS